MIPEWSSGFPHSLLFQSEIWQFGNKEFISEPQSALGCFCWLYRTSPSLAAKNMFNMILVLTIWWCPCVESPFVMLEECVCYDQYVLLTKLLAVAPLHFVLRGQTLLLLQVSLDFLLWHSSPCWLKGHLFLVLVLPGLIGVHRTLQLQLLQHYWSGHRLDYCDTEWFALEMNRDHSVVFEIASKYYISYSCWLSRLLHFF